MQYFILFPGDSEKDAILDTNILGEVSFGTFYTGMGWKALEKIVYSQPELISQVTIKSDRGNTISVEEFLKQIGHLKILS